MTDRTALDDNAARAEEARKRGNDLYKQGNLTGAESAYREAASQAPRDPVPLSNLSSVKFELGQYSAAIQFITKSLQLAKDLPLDEATERRQKALYARLVKCYMHESQFDNVKEAIKQVSDPELRSSVQDTLDGMTAWRSSIATQDQLVHRKRVFDRLPRYKAQLLDVAEYYAIGHDEAESLLDGELERSCSARTSFSFMLCGSGDARNLFATILDLHIKEVMSRKKLCSNVHFTILDLKPAALARTILLFDMICTYAILKQRNVPGIEDAPAIMAYVYAGHVVPAVVNDKLQTHIEGLIGSLEAGEPLFDWLFVPAATRHQVVYCLKQWREPTEAAYYRTGTVRKAVGNRLAMLKQSQMAVFGRHLGQTPPGLEKDRKIFDDLTVLLPSRGFAERRDPPLVSLLKRYENGSKGAVKELGEHIDANWVTNPTLIDADYAESRIREQEPWGPNATDEDKVPAIESDPIQLARSLPQLTETVSGVLGLVGTFFDHVSLAVVMFSQRMKVEAFVGEMSDIMERIRWGCLEARSQSSGGIDPSKFPRTYDRIHMSNIPDYVGGLLTAAMYGRPLLREDRTSDLRFNILLNPIVFSSHEHFEAEYLLMYGQKRISNHFSLTRKGANDGNILSPPLVSRKEPFNFLREGYIIWEKSPTKKLPKKDLFFRPALEKWLFAHYLKICLPFPREKFSDRPVRAPLNLTAFLRLVAHVSELGYPTHWLSGVLAALCGSEITTTARAPRSIAANEAEVDAVHPALKMTIAPWRSEFSTLLSIWSRLMPFGFITPPGAIAHPEGVAEYRVSFPPFGDEQMRLPHFMLLFWNSENGETPTTRRMRRILLDDGTGETSDAAKKIRHHGVHIFSTFKFLPDARVASFWCRTDTMQELLDGDWKVFIWRTDTWEQVTQGVSVVKNVRLLRSWDDQ